MKKTVKTLLSFLLVAVSLVCNVSIFPHASAASKYAKGLVWENWDDDDDDVIDGSTVDEKSLPKSVDLTSKFPPPGSQGNQKSCVAWAVGYALVSSQQITRRNWSRTSTAHHFSPAFIFNQLNGGVNEGITITDALNFVKSKGVCSLNYFPYNDSDFTTQPTAIQKAAASMYKAVGKSRIKGINTIKSFLSQGNGVIIGVMAYPDLENLNSKNPIYDTISGTADGGHAVCLIGYDDSKKAFKFINSWGTSWGLDGYGWISYDLVENAKVNHHGAARGYILRKASNDDYILGDINGDGKVTASDARQILRFSAKLDAPTAKQYVLSDANGDASVTASDAQNVLKYSANQISKLPLYE